MFYFDNIRITYSLVSVAHFLLLRFQVLNYYMLVIWRYFLFAVYIRNKNTHLDCTNQIVECHLIKVANWAPKAVIAWRQHRVNLCVLLRVDYISACTQQRFILFILHEASHYFCLCHFSCVKRWYICWKITPVITILTVCIHE